MPPHEFLPQITVVSEETISYDLLPGAGDPNLELQLEVRYSAKTHGVAFREVIVPMDLLVKEGKLETLDFYRGLSYHDNGPERYELVLGHINAINQGHELDPLVIAVEHGHLQLLDGFHRGAARRALNQEAAAAFELVSVETPS